MDIYVTTHTERPAQFLSGGQFITEKPWQHIERKIESYELIIGVSNTLFIDQEGEKYEVNPGDILLLVPDTVHKGYQQCKAGTSFYWFHFNLPAGAKISSNKTISKELLKLKANSLSQPGERSTIFLPFFFSPSKIERVNIIANQLLDVSNSSYYNNNAVNYIMTTLLIEISEQTIEDFHQLPTQLAMDQRIAKIMEWIRLHAFEKISVTEVANHFNYNRDYLSRIFKQKTNMHIQEYIHRIKLAKAKDLLTSSEYSIKEISFVVGIKDEKYFMRLFKRYEQMTPTAYRKAYYRTSLNNH